MAARQKAPEQYEVVGVLAVIRKDKHERYLDRGVVFPADMIDEDNAEHLVNVGLIQAVKATTASTADTAAAAKQKAADEAAAKAAADEKAAAAKAAADEKAAADKAAAQQ